MDNQVPKDEEEARKYGPLRIGNLNSNIPDTA